MFYNLVIQRYKNIIYSTIINRITRLNPIIRALTCFFRFSFRILIITQ